MILTTRGRYAIMAIIDMAEAKNDNPVCLSSISQRQNISLSYLEQIFSKLRKTGIVRSIKGPGGGYILNLKAEQITTADVIRAIEEPIKMTKCKNSSGGCTNKSSKCKTHNLWKGLEIAIYSYFQSVSIYDIVSN